MTTETSRQLVPSSAGTQGRLAGKVALVCGGASGIGRATAVAFAGAGASVLIADIAQIADATDIADSAGPTAGDVLYERADLTNAEQVARVIAGVVERWGRIDVLMNSVGIYLPAPITESTESDFDRTFTINVKSHYLTCRAVVPHMLAAESGSIINVSSNGGIMGRPGDPIYCASKHAIVGLTRSLAVAYAARNVRVNALCPGPIDTPMLRGISDGDFDGLLPQYLASCPAARLGDPSEVAAASLFLASDESAFITGAAIPIDGGKGAGSMTGDRYRLDFKIAR